MKTKRLSWNVIIGCLILFAFNIITMSNRICGEPDLSNMVIDAMAMEPVVVEPEPAEASMLSRQAMPKVAAYEEEVIEDICSMASITFKNNKGVIVETDVLEFDKTILCSHTDSQPDWDYKNRIQDIYIVWHFLVDELGVSPMNASAVCGSIYFEGTFGEEQGTGEILENIDDARNKLGTGKRGYGLAQWTFKERQNALLDYYELANSMFPDNWELAVKVAECCMLYEELKAYSVFSDIHVDTTVEDACGRVCLKYEAYRNSESQWKRTNGEYNLISNSGSGCMRLECAYAIYNYFMNEE